MKKLVRALRMTGYVFVLIVAAFAVGMTGHFLPITRERYQDKRNTTEQVDKKREEDDLESGI
jgi:hypothetical protein